jgi:D-alanyl-D-alanine carboxypeptidase (penicillin-binding protein 5/6)
MKKYYSWLLGMICLSLLTPTAQTFAREQTTSISLSTPLFEDEIVTPANKKQPILKTNEFLSNSQHASTDDNNPMIEAESYILMDYETGMVLAEKNKDQPRPPASMTKMMTAYIILDKIQSGEIKWDEEAVISKRAADIDEAQIFLEENEKITIKELFTGLMVQSANDAAVALAEHVAGSEEKFVALMNEKAKELGLTHTHFLNSSGLNQADYPDPPDTQGEHVMSAQDTADLAKELITTHPEIFKFTTIPQYTFHKGTTREQTVKNWNRMLPGLEHEYKGVDGIKTGSTQLAGYCFTGTAKQNNTRYMSVVMGTTSKDKRFTETAKLYDYGFQFTTVTFLKAGQAIPKLKSITIANAKEKRVSVVVQKSIDLPIQKGDKKNYSYHVQIKKNLKAPLKKGAVIGTVEILYKGKKIEGFQRVPIVTKNAVKEANFFDRFSQKIAG